MKHQSSANTTLDTATSNFLDGFDRLFKSLSDLSIPEQRKAIKDRFRIPESKLESIAKAENHFIHGRHGNIPIRVFSPELNKSLPIMLYFHRGGWVYGCIEESEELCRTLANKCKAIVIAVEYRLSPEYKFPIPLEDCYDATKWAIQHASTFSGDPNKVIVSGDSAGGNLAAAVSIMAKQSKEFSIAGQLLMYPVLTNDLDPINYENSPDKVLLSYENMQFFLDAYLSSPQDGENPLVSPLKSKDHSKIPNTFILTAEHDALKHEGEEYGHALQQAGVTVQTICYPKVIHGFLNFPLHQSIKDQAMQDITNWIKEL